MDRRARDAGAERAAEDDLVGLEERGDLGGRAVGARGAAELGAPVMSAR
jgi:hypothetical protein